MATVNRAFKVKNGLNVEGAELRPAPGTTTYPPILLTSGTNLTTATAGAFEYDGTNFYLTAATGGRKTIAFTDLAVSKATASVLGTIKLGSDTVNSATAASVGSTNGRTYLTQLNSSDQLVVNVPWTDTVYTLPKATATALGGIELFDVTVQSTAANAVTTTTSRTYGIQLDSSDRAVVNVPWENTFGFVGGYQTTSTAGSSVALTGINSLTSTTTLNLATPATTTSSALTITTGVSTGASSGAAVLETGTTAGTNGTTGSITIRTGAGNSSSQTSTGAISIQTGAGSGSGSNSGNITIDTGASSGTGSPGTVFIGGTNATTVELGRPGRTTVIKGNLQIDGTTTTVNSSTITVDDKNLELGSVSSGVVSTTGTIGSITGSPGAYTSTITGMSSTTGLIVGQEFTATSGTGGITSTPTIASIVSNTSITFTSSVSPTAGTVTNITGSAASDSSANGGGITLKGSTDKTLTWVFGTTAWTSSEDFNLVTGKVYEIAGTSVLSATTLGSGVVNSSLTSVGTIATGTWNATTIATNKGGTGLTSFTSGGAVYATSTSALTTGTLPVASGGTGITSFGTGVATALGNATGNTGGLVTFGGAIGAATATTAAVDTNTTQVATTAYVIGQSYLKSATAASTYVAAASPALTGTPTINALGAIATSTFTTSGTTPGSSSTVFARSAYNGAEVTIKASNSTNLHIIKGLLLIDASDNVYLTQYGESQSGAQALIGTLDFTVASGNVALTVTPASGVTGTTTYKAVFTLIAV